MCKIIDDFIKSAEHNEGYGYFEGNLIAVRYAKTIGRNGRKGRNQKRKYKRYGTIPTAFFNYLKAIGAIKREKFIPEKYRTLDMLLDLLSETVNQNTLHSSEAKILRTEILKDQYPEPKKTIGSAQHIWKKLETDGKLFGLKSY